MTSIRKELEQQAARLGEQQRAISKALEHMTPDTATDEPAAVVITLGTPMAEVERRLIFATLTWCDFNKTLTAQRLGLSRRSIYNKLAEAQATHCERCNATPTPEGQAWTLPNLCPPCEAANEAERSKKRNLRHRHLSDAGACAILRRARNGENWAVIADEYNVHVSAVRNIVNGRTYKHISRGDGSAPTVRHEGATLAGPMVSA